MSSATFSICLTIFDYALIGLELCCSHRYSIIHAGITIIILNRQVIGLPVAIHLQTQHARRPFHNRRFSNRRPPPPYGNSDPEGPPLDPVPNETIFG